MKAYVLIKASTGEVPTVLKHLRRVEAVQSAEVTFGEYDILATLETTNLEGMGNTLAREIQPIPGVENTTTLLAVDLT